jgi:hypothetical protein
MVCNTNQRSIVLPVSYHCYRGKKTPIVVVQQMFQNASKSVCAPQEVHHRGQKPPADYTKSAQVGCTHLCPERQYGYAEEMLDLRAQRGIDARGNL